MIPPMSLLEVTAERVYGAVLFGGIFLAVAVYLIRKQLRNPQNDPVKVIGLWVVSAVVVAGICYSAVAAREGLPLLFVLFVSLPIAVVVGIAWTPTLANMLSSPLTTALSGSASEAYESPAYGQALAKRKRGQFAEAVSAVDAQLERYPGDFEGLMLKATIQAENLNDLPAAAVTIQETLEDPEHFNYNLPVALNKMAEWQLTIAGDSAAARRTLQQIRTALPNSQAAQFAAQRLASLDSSEESESDVVDFNESYQKLVDESAAKDDFTGPLELPKAIESNRQQADEEELQTCLRRVEMHPDSINNREELAALYLDHATQPAKALEQYEHLLALPGTTIHQKTAWLNKLADIKVKSGESYETVRATLERIVALDPRAAPAARAQQRISYVRIELRSANRKTSKLQLGSYEDDLGLKS